MASIKHNPAGHPLPDFRNFGVMLRVLLGVNLFALAAALVQSQSVVDWTRQYVEMAAWVQPLLLANMAVLGLFAPAIRLLPARWGQAAVVALAVLSALLLIDFWRFMGLDDGSWQRSARAALLAGFSAGAMLFYFEMRARMFSPALTEARLQALTARIRPHFLFNSLNAVLSLIRSQPRRAEEALEELADLFRVLMRDHRDLLPLADEIALCRQYLDLEKLRLGERLVVDWNVKSMPEDALAPPLVLQPLLENAVYHGIEPSTAPGVISVNIFLSKGEVHAILRNPYRDDGGRHHRGNRMAIANIRERLALHFDAEAALESRTLRDSYEVHIRMPYRTVAPPKAAGEARVHSAGNVVALDQERAKPRNRTALRPLEAARG
jgi:two-component system sensor histidine kinase AlgZ